MHNHDPEYQSYWITTTFANWLRNIDAKHKIVVGGNHDFAMQRWNEHYRHMPWTYLQDRYTEVEGLKIWGTPWVTNLPSWAFNATELDIAKKYDKMPRDVDIIVSHGPAYGIVDRLVGIVSHVGSTTAANRLMYEDWPKLKAFVCGHIHEAHGYENVKGIDFYNVAYLDRNYDIDNPNGYTEIVL